ncbi:hypothetical protein [Pseudoxanthomonas sp. JBR18]|uniref:hypothetical protein n=1 Tax=Pseudoxanthomonas sp. JBR18 TaxID=2969308 RepID=UPI0023066247|nr:hypothetical protein [Pseudoxanthomonas sp. JBR18]WCE06197.1 hypothetical protein PJ250_09725 [Pseudoxanthomonas sp. JBR18]
MLVVSVASAESQRIETVTYTGFDAKQYTRLFQPLLDNPHMRFSDNENTWKLQTERLRTGAYAALVVQFNVHRTGPATMDAPLVSPDHLPKGVDDVATLVSCGDAVGGSGYQATIETKYKRDSNGWEPEAYHYQQVKDCASAMQAYAKQ